MMNRLMRYSCLLLCLSAGLTACDDDGIDVLDIEIPEGYALSAGTSTILSLIHICELSDFPTMANGYRSTARSPEAWYATW